MEGSPRVACYCATFLRPEMLHIHRQIRAVRRFPVTVFTQKRENADRFPFGDVVVVPHGNWRWLQRIVEMQLLRRPLLLGRGETKRLDAALTSHRCAILHVFFGNIGVQLLPLLRHRRGRGPVIVSFHGADVLVGLDNASYRRAAREVCELSTLVLARSRSLVDALRALGCPVEKIRLNRTGIPLAEFPYFPRENPGGRFRLFQACRLIEKKGLPTTLRAFARFAGVFPESRLTIAGEGPLEAPLRQLAGELGIAEKVEFAGFLEQTELRRRLYESHLFLHPSELGRDGNQEGVPNSLLEAMASGLPVFATTHGGIPEAVEHGVSGWLVAEGDHEALGRAMVELASSSDRLAAMGAAAARSVAANFDADAQARNLEDCYQEAMTMTAGTFSPEDSVRLYGRRVACRVTGAALGTDEAGKRARGQRRPETRQAVRLPYNRVYPGDNRSRRARFISMPYSASPQLWVVVTRPDNLPAALTAARGLADQFPGGCRLILEESSWWQNAGWERFRAGFAAVHAFSRIASCRGLRDLPRMYRQFAARQRALAALPFVAGHDALLCLAGVTGLANAACAAFGRVRRVLCLSDVLHDHLIRSPGSGQYRFTTSGWLQNHFVEPLVGLERTLHLKPRVNHGGDGVRLLRLRRAPEEVYDAVVVMSNTGLERPPGTGARTHTARFPDLGALGPPASTPPDGPPPRRKVVFFGTPYLLVRNLPRALYVEHLNPCLDFLRRSHPDADLVYRPHPAETTETAPLRLEGFRVEMDLEVAELYFLREFAGIEAVYSVSSTVSRVALNAGLDAYAFWRCFPFEETQVRFFEKVMGTVPAEFEVRDLSAPPRTYAERRRAAPAPDAGPTFDDALRRIFAGG